TGANDQSISNIVHIGIGGSYLGPKMVCEVLPQFAKIKCHFVAGLDAMELTSVLKQCDPATTLFIIASKTFTTQETLCNADRAKQWLSRYINNTSLLERHFIAITANEEKAVQWGIQPDKIFKIWNWVGGR